MTRTQKALALAAAMISIGVLAVFDVIPEKYAQFAPLALIALFPGVWMRRGHSRNCFKRREA